MIIANTMATIAAALATFFFISAFFPSWPVRWGRGRGSIGPSAYKRVPISVQGRLASGFFCAYFSLCIIIDPVWQPARIPLNVGLVVLVIGMYFVHRRDLRKWDQGK